MIIVTAVIVLAVIIVAIWVLIEIKRMKHKLFAIFLIAALLFLYFSISSVFKGREINLTTPSGIFDAVKIYFSWLGYFFTNLKSVTTNAINSNWKGNFTSQNSS